MAGLATYWSDTDLGEMLGGQFTTVQIYYLAGVLFFTLFGLSALRHGKRAGGWLPAVWGTVAIGLFVAALYTGGRGFPEYIPDAILPFINPDSLTRLTAVLALLMWAVVFLSAHWVNGALSKWWHRVAGIVVLGSAVWLTTGWFGDEIPAEAKPWTAQTVLIRLGTLLGLGFLTWAFWTRGRHHTEQLRWTNRALAPMALAGAVYLGLQWFGFPTNDLISRHECQQLLVLLGSVASGTCLVIAAGAWMMRTRRPQPESTKPVTSVPPPAPPPKAPVKPLPVAVLLDAQGRPIAPPS